MNHRGPLITLLAGVVLAAVLTVLSVRASTEETADATNAAASAGATPSAEATTPTPTPSQPTAAEGTIPPGGSPAAPPGSGPGGQPTSTPPATADQLFAGRVDNGRATIAIAITGAKAVAYLCDGKKLESWLRGPATNGRLDLTGAAGARLTATYTGSSARGTAVALGQRWTFTAPIVQRPAGLYRVAGLFDNARVVGGWIVLPDGSQVGVLNVNGQPKPAPRFDVSSGTATVDGAKVPVAPADPNS